MGHACHPGYLGGREGEHYSSRPLWAKSSWGFHLNKEPRDGK
jgi:hypothetical protein